MLTTRWAKRKGKNKLLIIMNNLELLAIQSTKNKDSEEAKKVAKYELEHLRKERRVCVKLGFVHFDLSQEGK